MSTFANYSAYYDLIYSDKDYSAEVAYVDRLIKKHNPNAKSILNLGCGTGKHDFYFSKLGYEVVGMDLSQDMVNIAKSNFQTSNVQFQQGDIRSIRLDHKFDVVVSLFHVLSYQTSNEDVKASFATARAHLTEGGIFICDYWYGPGVLTDPPVTRVKRVENNDIKVLRIAEPLVHYHRNVVDVFYEIRIAEKGENQHEEIINEMHSVRYFFAPEISLFSQSFNTLNTFAWLTSNVPKTEWFVVSILG
jgi:SAM-dependent methyltransferase